MSHTPITPDDPRLTAYVLGELDETDGAAVEAAVAADPACRQAVEELQQTTAELFEALQIEPLPALSDSQREAIRSATRPRVVRVPEPATRGRRGMLPLLAATIACATLLVGVSAWDFERPAVQTAALFDNAQNQGHLLAFQDSVDGLGVVDELQLGQPDRASRLDALVKAAEREAGVQQRLRGLSRESEDLRQTIVASDGKTPSVTMNIEEVEPLYKIPLHERALTAEQLQGLASTSSRPDVPGNLGDVVHPTGDFVLPPSSAGAGSLSGMPAPASGLDGKAARPDTGRAPGSSSGAAGDVLRSKVHEYRRPTVEYEQQLGRQAGQQGARGGAYVRRYYPVPGGEPQSGQGEPGKGEGQGQTAPGSDPAARWGYYSQAEAAANADGAVPAAPSRGYAGPEIYFRFDGSTAANAAQQAKERSGTAPATGPAQPSAGGIGGGVNEMLLYDPYGGSGQEPGGMPQQAAGRGEALRENLAGVPRQSGVQNENGDGAWLDLDFSDASGRARGWDGNLNLTLGMDSNGQAQFVPKFAVTDLQRLSEQAPSEGASGIAAGATLNFDGGPPVMSNGATVSEEMLLGAGLAESEVRRLQEQRGRSLGLGGRQLPLCWENGRWYAITRGGRKVAVNVPGTEAYAPIREDEFLSPREQPLSTFGLDVDTASYANVRRFLMDQRRFPPPDAVRIEELVNYFAYSDPQPAGGEPVGVSLEASACPWNPEHRLVRIGVKAREIDLAERPPTTLVFLIDTSGSMRDDNKLPLVKDSLRILVNEMTENDRIAIVTYSSNAGLLLDSTSGEHRQEILAAIEGLHAGGSTNGEEGLKLAYEIADRHFIEHGQNRVILCTDGDFNVGTSATGPLVKMIADKRDTGVFLSICGYGTGNIKDEKLERIADTGNGQYHYVDNLKEARKVFLDELTGTLYTVARDVKLQVEFNPAHVASYRLLGYENRTMAAEDFNNDRVDSGDMGAGHSVTALYEVVPVGVEPAKPASETPGVDPLKYQRSEVGDQKSDGTEPLTAPQRGAPGDTTHDLKSQISESAEWLTVKLRYKQPDGDESVKREFPLVIEDEGNESPSSDLQWSAAVASFGMLLRSSQYAGESSLEGVLELAQSAKGRDESGRRREFIDMVLQTRSLVRRLHGSPIPQPRELSSTEARQKATVAGKYEHLLDKFEARGDAERYGEFHEYGWSADKSHAGRTGLPAGYWVYVYPDWYIWGETVSARE